MRALQRVVIAGVSAWLIATWGPAARAQSAPDISGVWTLQGYKPTRTPARERIPKTVDGQAPPLQPWAAQLYEQRLKDSDEEHPFATLSSRCLPDGMPLMMADGSYPMQIIQSPDQVTILFELWHVFRVIRLNQKHQEDLDPGLIGDSIGHYEGDTLVVDTAGVSSETTLDATGIPHSDSMHLVERIRRVDPMTLEDLVTVDDPKTFTRPWTMRWRYSASKDHIQEFFCENQRNAPNSNGSPSFQK